MCTLLLLNSLVLSSFTNNSSHSVFHSGRIRGSVRTAEGKEIFTLVSSGDESDLEGKVTE